MKIEQIKALITEHTAEFNRLAAEKMELLERCDFLTKEMVGLRGVINTLKYMEVNYGDIQRNDGTPARNNPGESAGQGQPGQGAEQPGGADIGATSAAVVQRQPGRLRKAR